MKETQTNEQRILNLLEANVRAELRTRGRMLELVEAQERAVRANQREALETHLAELEPELARAASQSSARARLVVELAGLWGLAPNALTLGSIAERAGPRGAVLAGLRKELRDLVADLARRNRRLGALIALQRRIVRDVVGAVLGNPEEDVFRAAGTVLSTEA